MAENLKQYKAGFVRLFNLFFGVRRSAKAALKDYLLWIVLAFCTAVYMHLSRFDHCSFDSAFFHLLDGPVRIAAEPPSAYPLPPQAVGLPNLRGGGALPDLHDAMTKQWALGDSALVDAVSKLSAGDLYRLASPDTTLVSGFREILFLWADASHIEPESRGDFIDARELAFLEKLSGRAFRQMNIYPDPAPWAASDLKQEFEVAFDKYYLAFLRQGAAGELYAGDHSIHPEAIDRLAVRIADMPQEDRRKSWQNIFRAVKPLVQHGPQADDNTRLLREAIFRSAPELSASEILASVTRRPESETKVFTNHAGKQISFHWYFSGVFAKMVCIRPDRESDRPNLYTWAD